jgi:hypothetical protein
MADVDEQEAALELARRQTLTTLSPFMTRASDEAQDDRPLPARNAGDALAPEPDEPPVVARMIIEIRSDGTRTIARGAIEDTRTGERATVQAEGTTPLSLAASLTKHLFTAPALAKQAAIALLQSRLKK